MINFAELSSAVKPSSIKKNDIFRHKMEKSLRCRFTKINQLDVFNGMDFISNTWTNIRNIFEEVLDRI